jgi:hypothetical protein
MNGIVARSHRSQNSEFLFIIRDALLVFIALFGYVYYCYKFGSPDLGNNDFYQYKGMVERPFDADAAPAPFVLRQLPAAVAHLFYVLGIFYDTKTNLDTIFPGDVATKRIVFALILSNALAAGISFLISLHYIRKKTCNNNIIICFAYIGIMLSYFYFPFSIIAPLATGWGWLTSTILAVALLDRKLLLVFLGSVLTLVTRETILIFTLAFSILAWASFGRRDRFFLWSAFILAIASTALILLRAYFVHGYEYEFDLRANILSFTLSRAYVFQALISQALIVILLLSLCTRHRCYAQSLFLSTIAVIVMGIGTGQGPAIGRAIGETLPFYAMIFLLLKIRDIKPYEVIQER